MLHLKTSSLNYLFRDETLSSNNLLFDDIIVWFLINYMLEGQYGYGLDQFWRWASIRIIDFTMIDSCTMVFPTG